MKLLAFLTFVILATVTVESVNVVAKLDFQSDKLEKPKVEKVVITNTKAGKADEFDNIGVVCVSGGCNTTKSENATTKSSDVVIEIKTANVDESKKKNETKEEIPDVPIVVGYAGAGGIANFQRNPNDNVINPHPIQVTYLDEMFPALKKVASFLPSLGPPIPPANRGDQDYDSIRYNGISNPYYDPSYTKYYYNTNPSRAQSSWNSRNNGGIHANPLGFNRTPKPDWRTPAPWYTRRQGNNYYRNAYYRTEAPGLWTTCSCHPNAVWQPTTAAYKQSAGDEINDKLAPLN